YCISRSTKHFIELSELFNDMGVHFVSITVINDTSTAMVKFFFRTIASIAELERDIISERTKSGLQAARAKGKKVGRPTNKEYKVEMAV
ncbi:recombinase family protein, partial [Bacillus sp. BML-BC060]|uniref:recombinase family protein n=1 Tax=Bacillus sp. BML-BC060 TaxID=2842487 RepID=UPI001C81ECEA